MLRGLLALVLGLSLLTGCVSAQVVSPSVVSSGPESVGIPESSPAVGADVVQLCANPDWSGGGKADDGVSYQFGKCADKLILVLPQGSVALMIVEETELGMAAVSLDKSVRFSARYQDEGRPYYTFVVEQGTNTASGAMTDYQLRGAEACLSQSRVGPLLEDAGKNDPDVFWVKCFGENRWAVAEVSFGRRVPIIFVLQPGGFWHFVGVGNQVDCDGTMPDWLAGAPAEVRKYAGC